MAIIKQNAIHSAKSPDFRNLGICLRILVVANLMGLFASLAATSTLADWLPGFTRWCAFMQPVLLASLLALYALQPWLARLGAVGGYAIALWLPAAFSLLAHMVAVHALDFDLPGGPMRSIMLAAGIASITLAYLQLRQRALSPAVTEARLQALQARIRPHFLFNSINAVLSIVRSDSKRAETALMDMADLFRVLMADNRELVPLAQELALCRQYLALEKLRLENRLSIDWQVDEMPPDALIPPLILQPLLENAIYHGIEPLDEGGSVSIQLSSTRDELHIRLRNPYQPGSGHHQGNRMAIGNIRERLQLHFDAEASLNISQDGNEYAVHIVIPYRKRTAS
ncbi:sensor histidine kinase [Methylobacillus flagellatus]|uniref:sensor histidine kinase n=1 Tax=Methylobacillus flagellatus TaxID=405 RepID=UPI002853D280|nr:sensor histidine kinase [Methylobacillus flagellatus]MDR5172166.1 sensor histidine kinase [Methylobacillus flagellatus]